MKLTLSVPTGRPAGWYRITKICRVMKLSAILILTVCLQATAASVAGQNVTLRVKNATLKEVFRKIQQQTGLDVFLDESFLEKAGRISIDVSDLPVEHVLDICLKDKPFVYTIQQGRIVVKPQSDKTAWLPAVLQQFVKITGIIKDAEGNPLVGASVSVKETRKGVATGETGEFSLDAEPGQTLIVSYVGFVTQTIKVGEARTLTIVLEKSPNKLDDLVVVGYGMQKKVSQTGSLATVSGQELNKRPAPNVQNLLQGRVAGLDIVQGTGQPGRDNASILIRGVGSFGSSSAPLVLVDGVIGSISNLAPEDIADVTVLKDASSAAIYGARAANGVILVTTKKGRKGQSVLEYSFNVGRSTATRLPDLVYNSAQYMELRNKASIRVGQPAFYSQDKIDAYKNATDKTKYPDFNWMDYAFNPATTQNHRLGFSGGTEKSTYNFSLNYLKQDGVLEKNDYKRYNALLDFTTQVHKRVKVGANVNFSHQLITEPWQTNDGLVLILYHSAPTFGPYLPDGSGRIASNAYPGESQGQRSYPAVLASGGQFTKRYNVNAQAFATVDIAKGWVYEAKGAFSYFNEDYRNRQFPTPSYYYQPDANGVYQLSDNGSPTFEGLNQTFSQSITQTFYNTLSYTTTIANGHNIQALGGYEQQSNQSPSLSGTRRGFPSNDLNELGAGSATGQTATGNTTEWALQSLFGRINYDYKSKYFFTGNIRYDGTSRVAPDTRWGLFGGVSAGWRISEENFIKEKMPWISNLKIRGGIGNLGNQEIANYPYQDILTATQYPFGPTLNQGAVLTRLVDKSLKWESTRITDIGLEFDFLNGLIGGSAGWYNKYTSGILAQRTDVPGSVGLTAPTFNAGAMENKGWELELRHNNRIGEVSYGVSALYSAYKNQVKKVVVQTPGTLEVGVPYNSYYLYDWAGVFQSQEEIDKWAKQPNSGVLRPGDLKIKDQNGNGTVGPEDRIRVSPYPGYTYSLNMFANWKGFNLTVFLQGVQGRKLLVRGWGIEPFGQGAPPPKKWLNAWTPENPSQTLPAIYLDRANYPGVTGYNSTFFMQDASYFRLKNVYLSYSLPQHLLDRISSKGLTVYVSGDNLLTATKYEGADPERAGGGNFSQFPQLKTWTLGLNVKF